MDDTQRLRIYRPDEGDLAVDDSNATNRRVTVETGEIVAPFELTVGTPGCDAAPTTNLDERRATVTNSDITTEPSGILSQATGLLRRFMLFTGYLFAACWLTGCTAFRPLHGIPVRQLPPELRGISRANLETIDISRLSQTPHVHFVDSGDLLGIYVYGILGKLDETPPVFIPANGDGNPTIGLPIPVREDGTISLPQIPPVYVRGMTVRQVEEAVRREYVSRQIRKDGVDILVSLQKSRAHRVTVLRQETANAPITGLAGGGIQLGATKKGTGQIVTLPAGENDVLRALTLSGGLPGLDAQNAVYVLRRPRLVRQLPPPVGQLPPPVGVTSNSTGRRKSNSVTPIVLTSGTTGAGSRYEFAPGTGNSRGGFSVPSGYSPPAVNPQMPVQLEGPRDTGSSWGQPSSVARTRFQDVQGTPPNGSGYSIPMIPGPPDTQVDSDGAPLEQLPAAPSVNTYPGTGSPFNEMDSNAIPGPDQIVANRNAVVPPELQPYMMSGAVCFRIPIRLRPGEQAYFTENDILLFDGDIIFIESRETEIFYTGGLLGGGQYSLPRDYDLDVIDAISIAQGRVSSAGATGTGSHLGGIASTNQDISVGASRLIVVRRLADGRRVNIKIDLNKAIRDENENLLVQPGDHLVLRYTPIEAIGAFIERNLLAGSLIGLATQTQGLGSSK
jgi:protein involved in polysaccharide export with SLBB domain